MIYLKPITLRSELRELRARERMIYWLKMSPVSLLSIFFSLSLFSFPIIALTTDSFDGSILPPPSDSPWVLNVLRVFFTIVVPFLAVLVVNTVLTFIWSLRDRTQSLVMIGGSVGLLVSSILIMIRDGFVLSAVLQAPLQPFSSAWLFSYYFSFVYLRLFYLPLQVIQYLRIGDTAESCFTRFRQSPVHWDEFIPYRLPCLASWLVRLVEHDRKRGRAELAVVARRRFQRGAAEKALQLLFIQELKAIDSLRRLAAWDQNDVELIRWVARGRNGALVDLGRRMANISQCAIEYFERVTPAGRKRALEELERQIEALQEAAAFLDPIVLPVIARWLGFVEEKQSEYQSPEQAAKLPNPFVTGIPLQPGDNDVFKGRRDIVSAIEEHIVNTDQRPALLLYGRRRIGKTSILLNLRRLLSSRFLPVFIDLQDARYGETDGMFCYHVIYEILRQLRAQDIDLELVGIVFPTREQYIDYPFTQLAKSLDQIEAVSERLDRRVLLTFDEYERIEERLMAGTLTKEILNQLRNIVQHRTRIGVLLSGGRRLGELSSINWSDYLINVTTLELSFLSEDDSRNLLTQPIPGVRYQPGTIGTILSWTHCQPYLLQAIAFELVQNLNQRQEREVAADNVESAVESVLRSAQGYFSNTWQDECSEEERDVLREVVEHGTIGRINGPRMESVVSLCRKEVLERVDGRYQFTIELFRRWIVKDQQIVGFSQPVRPRG